jgi:hypothetical protein
MGRVLKKCQFKSEKCHVDLEETRGVSFIKAWHLKSFCRMGFLNIESQAESPLKTPVMYSCKEKK